METVPPLLSHLTILSASETERIKTIARLLPSIDEKIEMGIKNSADSTSNYSKPFWNYFKDVLSMVEESLSEEGELSVWLIGELGDRIKRIEWIASHCGESSVLEILFREGKPITD